MAQVIEITLEEAEAGVEAFKQLFEQMPDDICEADENLFHQLNKVIEKEKEES